MASLADSLNNRIQNGVTHYVALLTTMPSSNGIGAVEVSGSGYARVAWSSWIDETIDSVLYRKNNGTIEFPVLTAPVSAVVGFAVYSTSTAGDILAWGTFRNSDDDEVYKNFFAGEMPRFIDQELKISGVEGLSVAETAPLLTRNLYHIAWSPTLGLFAAMTSGNRIQTSPDGVVWTDRFTLNNGSGTSICWSEEIGCFIGVLYSGDISVRVVRSVDGITWTEHSASSTNSWQCVCYATWLNLFVAVANGGTNRVMTSPDGSTWTARSGDTGAWKAIAAAPEISMLVAVASDGVIMYSANGTSWTAGTASLGGQNWTDIAWSPDLTLFVALAVNSGYTMTSPDGINWTTRVLPLTGQLFSQVKWSPLFEQFIATSIDGTNACVMSVDGITYTQVYLGHGAARWNEINAEHPSFVLIAEDYPATTLLFLTDYTLNAGYAEIDVVDENSLQKLQAYLPPGLAWTRDSDSVLTKLLRPLAYGFARISRRALDLLEEVDPRTTYELLEDWERVYALPDDCNQPTTIAGRRTALQNKMNGNDSPTIENLNALAAEVGYDSDIQVYRRADLFTCISPCNAALYGDDWMFVWTMSAWPGDSDAALECTLDAVTPQHTTLVMNMVEFEAQTSASARIWFSVCWASELSLFCTVGYDGTTANQIMTSPDGITWTLRTSPSARQWISLCWSPDLLRFCAVAYDGLVATQVMTSTDGITWTSRTSASARQWTSVCWSPELSLFCAVAYDGTTANQIMTSPDGFTWTSRTSPSARQWRFVCWSPELSLFCAVAYDGTTSNQIMTSPDGITWTSRTSPSARQWISLCWSPELSLFCAIAFDGTTANQIMTSPDGITWTSRTSPSAREWISVCWSPELGFCAVAQNGTAAQQIMTSPDGITWTARTAPSARGWFSVCWSPELYRFAAIASTGVVAGQVMLSTSWRV